MRGLAREFRNFAFSGNLVDLAVGIAIGVAFGALVQSLVDNLIMPLVAAIFGKPNFDNLYFRLHHSKFTYGKFLTTLVAFLVLALTLMFLLKGVRRLTGKEAAGAQGNRECDFCKSFVPVDATVCMFCTRDIEPVVAE
jgi:large conductance mechanosensitive channel